MKTRICLFFALALLCYCTSDSKGVASTNKPSSESSLNVLTTPDLYNLAMKWVSEYGVLNPGLKISVIKAEGKNVSEMLHYDGGIGFVLDESWVAHNNQSNWNMIVGRNIIVPIMNKKNPILEEINLKGFTSKGLLRILKTSQKQNWSALIENTANNQDGIIHYYIMNDPFIISRVENFLGVNNLSNEWIKTESSAEMISTIQKDLNALGFCSLTQIMNQSNQSLPESIQLAPIDKNGNGKIDYMENIYDNLQAFMRGVWIGKYPRALCGKIFTISSEKPKDENELAFLNWILTDGQQFLNPNGYNDLVLSERQTQLAKINDAEINIQSPANETNALLKMIFIAILAVGVAIVMWHILVRRIRTPKEYLSQADLGSQTAFDENSVIIPRGIYFGKTHTWAFMKKDGTVKIGIDDFLQHVTGSITRIELKKTGTKIKKGDTLITIIQKGKQLDIYSPISGTIKTGNESLYINPSLLNSAPFEAGWIYALEPANWSLEIQYLNMAEKYRLWLKKEFIRLKDFFAVTIKSDTPEYTLIALQDGGALKDNILADLGPEVWDDFQTKFIDAAK